MKSLTFYAFLLVTTIILAARIASPSDIYDQHQPRTIAYTADMVRNGRLLLPHDALDIPATKPPLYNWLSLPAVMLLGRWDEFLLKLPSLAAGLATIGTTLWMARYLLRNETPLERGVDPQIVAAIAGIAWITSYNNLKLIYLARPDMLLTACLTAAWVFATLAMEPERKNRLGVSLAFWLAVAGAGLSKGTPALVALVYVPIAAKLIHGRWSAALRLGWWWGLPLALLLAGGWLAWAYQQDSNHVRELLLGHEVGDRLGRRGPLGHLRDLPSMPLYFLSRFLPWSIIATVVIVTTPPRRCGAHPLGPAILWLLVVLAFFMAFTPGGRPDFIAPSSAAIAILAAYGVAAALNAIDRQNTRRSLSLLAAACVIYASFWAAYLFLWGPAAKEGYGENAKNFAARAREIVGRDAVAFEGKETQVVETLMGRNEVGRGAAASVWVVRPVKQDEQPAVISADIATSHGDKPRRLGLFPIDAGGHGVHAESIDAALAD